MAKRNELCKKELIGADCVFTFANGQVVRCEAAALPDEARDFVTAAGIRQLVGDAFSDAMKNGGVEAAIAMAEAKWEALLRGDTRTRTEGGNAILPYAVERVLAAEGKVVPIATIRETVKAMDKEARRGLEKDPRILAAIADIQRERAEAAPAQSADPLAAFAANLAP